MLGYPISTLSTELIDEIVNYVDLLGNKKDIQSLFAADRSFSNRCRAILFKTLAVTVAQPKSLQVCRTTLDHSPNLIPYIRELQLQRASGIKPQDVWSGSQPDFDNIIQTLSTSPRPLSSFKLSGRLGHPESFAHWITNSFFSSALVALQISSVENFPLAILGAFPNLPSLDFDLVNSVMYELDEESSLSGLIKLTPELEDFRYRSSYNIVRLLLEASHSTVESQYTFLQRLRILHCHDQEQETMAQAQVLINQSFTTLEDLSVSITPQSQGFTHLPLSGFLSLGKLEELRRFTATAPIAEGTVGRDDVATDIAIVLSTIPESNKVAFISLCIKSFGIPPWPSTRRQNWLDVSDEICRLS
ncbi:hypothetical protein BKA70DRAFT_1483807, partial [Coprinopsis sp. MPI-PUGE-AT-0042]